MAEADARDLAKQQLAYGSTGDWVTHLAGLRRGEGKRRVARAKALTGPLSRTRAALVAGTCSPGPGRRDRVGGRGPPTWGLDPPPGEKLMLRHAQSLDATELTRAGRHLVAVVDPDGLDRSLEAALEREERAAHLGRSLSITADRAGGVRIRGRGTAEDGALLTAALLPLTRPATRPHRRGRDRETLHPAPRPPRPRRPPVGRPGHPRPPRPRHRPGPRLPRRPRPAPGHPRPPDPARHPRSQRCGHHRRRPRPTPRRHPPPRV